MVSWNISGQKNFVKFLAAQQWFSCSHVDVGTVLSAVVMCGPTSVRLDKPVILSFPHCASVKHGQWSLSLFTSHSAFDEPPLWIVRYLLTYLLTVARWRSGYALDLRLEVAGSIPAAALSSATLDKLFTHIVQRLWCYNLMALYKSV